MLCHGDAERITARIIYTGPLIRRWRREEVGGRKFSAATHRRSMCALCALIVAVGSITRRASDAAKEYGLVWWQGARHQGGS